jgi:hypothetical protein
MARRVPSQLACPKAAISIALWDSGPETVSLGTRWHTRPRTNAHNHDVSSRARTLLTPRAMRTSLSSLLAFSTPLAIALAQLACGGRVDGVPNPGTNPPASSTEPTLGGGSSSSSGTAGGKATTPSADPAESCKLSCDEGHTSQNGELPCAPGYACYTRTCGGTTIACTGPAGLCEEPDCLGYTQKVKSCPPGATCEAQQFCDVTLICEKSDAQCDGLPACDEEDQEVANATECAKNGAACYSRTECGGRVFCVKGQ